MKFTKEFIASELALAEKATPGPIVMEWNWQWGMKSIMAWVETPRRHGDKFMDVAEVANNDRLYCESAYNNYPAALAEIQRLQEKLDAAEKVCKVIKEFRDNGEFFDPDTCRALDAWEKIK